VGSPDDKRAGWLCRIGLHDRASVQLVDGTCREETRCGRCGRLRTTSEVHDWGAESPKDVRCISKAACRRCATERILFKHRDHEVVYASLSFDESARFARPNPPGPCDIVATCLDCGRRDITYREEHDEEADPPFRCRRCGHFYDDDEA
jgi:DNA-directed RNA polymerase subunit RPC12/RpoP